MALPSESLEHYRRQLTALRGELAAESSRAESEVGDQSDLAHLDPVDRTTAASAKEELLQSASRETEQIERIDDALRRIENGTYGICSVCGREIPRARLDAVPWAEFCVADQEIADRRVAAGTWGGAPSRVA
jgi:DnaK suppressor protein